MSFRRKRPSADEINVTPMIDVLLVLLIFFMVASHFDREDQLAINLPSAEVDAAPDAAETTEISIARDGSYALNGVDLVNRQPGTLAMALQRMAAEKKDLPLVINADADASHQAVVTAMDVAGRAGFHRLRISTQPTASSPAAGAHPAPGS